MQTIKQHLETLPELATPFSPLFLSLCEADVHTRFDMKGYWSGKGKQDLMLTPEAGIEVSYTAEYTPGPDKETGHFTISGITVNCYAESTVEAV